MSYFDSFQYVLISNLGSLYANINLIKVWSKRTIKKRFLLKILLKKQDKVQLLFQITQKVKLQY